jgi:hypothetical protein
VFDPLDGANLPPLTITVFPVISRCFPTFAVHVPTLNLLLFSWERKYLHLMILEEYVSSDNGSRADLRNLVLL